MKFYKLKISYDGTDYQGWQEQKDVQTISGQLKKTFHSIFNQELSIVGASRTDAGVHAQGQVARIRTDLAIDANDLMSAWNNSLPKDILVLSCDEVNKDFHPLYNVEQKTYLYHFYLQRPLPFYARYGWYFRWNVDLDKLQKCLDIFKGTHDFRSFCTGYEMDSTVRTIDDIQLKENEILQAFQIEVRGKSFLHHMIRRIVGACLEVSSRPKLSQDYLKEVLEQKNPQQSLPNADASGLMLYDIQYK